MFSDPNIDELVKIPISMSLRAKRGNLVTHRITKRLPRRLAPRNDRVGLFTKPSILMTCKFRDIQSKEKEYGTGERIAGR
jgi:hypothetical protein